MRMASALATLLAVLCGAVADTGDVIGNLSRTRLMTDEGQFVSAWKRSYWKNMHSILRKESSSGEDVQCCPSVIEMVAKKGGRTPTGIYVELFEDGENQQRLYEISCQPNVVNQPCRFVDARLYNESRCIQKYSYSYALVRHIPSAATDDPQQRTEGYISVPGSGGWSMDYVRVRAGCECEIMPTKVSTPRRRHKPSHARKRTAAGKRNKHTIDNDDT